MTKNLIVTILFNICLITASNAMEDLKLSANNISDKHNNKFETINVLNKTNIRNKHKYDLQLHTGKNNKNTTSNLKLSDVFNNANNIKTFKPFNVKKPLNIKGKEKVSLDFGTSRKDAGTNISSKTSATHEHTEPQNVNIDNNSNSNINISNELNKIFNGKYTKEQLKEICDKSIDYYMNELKKVLNNISDDTKELNNKVDTARKKLISNIKNNRFQQFGILHKKIMDTTNPKKLFQNFNIKSNSDYKKYYSELIANIWSEKQKDGLNNFSVKNITQNANTVLVKIYNNLNNENFTEKDILEIKNKFLFEEYKPDDLKGINTFKVIANLACYILDWVEYLQLTYEKFTASQYTFNAEYQSKSVQEYQDACKKLGVIFQMFGIAQPK